MPSIGSLANPLRAKFDPADEQGGRSARNRLVECFLEIERLLNAASSASSGNKHFARVANTALQSIPNNVLTAIIFNSTRAQNGDMHSDSSQNTRFTAQRTGFYTISGHIQWAANAVGERSLGIRLGGTTLIASTEEHPGVAVTIDQSISTGYYLNAGDYVEVVVLQNSGGALNVNKVGNLSPEGSIGEH